MKVFWLHLRSSPIRWVVPALTAMDLAVLFLRNRYWIGVWPETGAAAQVSTYVLGPIVTGAAAWAAMAPARYELTEQLAATRVHRAVSQAFRLGATIVLLVVPYLIGQTVAFTMTARTHPPGLGLWFGYFAHGVFVTLLTLSLGWIIGTFSRSPFAALGAALACLLLLGLADRWWWEFSVISGPPDMAVDLPGVVVRLVSVVALLATLLWVPAGKRRATVLVAPALGVLAIVVAMGVTPVTVQRPPAGEDAMCVDGRMSLCIWPEHEKYVPALEELLTRVDALPATFVLPPRMNQFGIERIWQVEEGPDGLVFRPVADGAPYFYILAGSRWSFASDISSAIMNTTLVFAPGQCERPAPEHPDMARVWALHAWLETYLAGGGDPDYRTDAPPEMQNAWAIGRAMAKNPLVEQFRWAEREVNDLRGRYCQH